MQIVITVNTRPNKPFLLSVENKGLFKEGQNEFVLENNSPLVNAIHCSCTAETFAIIEKKVGTIEAPALIQNVDSPIFQNRLNVYIENGSLKIVS